MCLLFCLFAVVIPPHKNPSSVFSNDWKIISLNTRLPSGPINVFLLWSKLGQPCIADLFGSGILMGYFPHMTHQIWDVYLCIPWAYMILIWSYLFRYPMKSYYHNHFGNEIYIIQTHLIPLALTGLQASSWCVSRRTRVPPRKKLAPEMHWWHGWDEIFVGQICHHGTFNILQYIG